MDVYAKYMWANELSSNPIFLYLSLLSKDNSLIHGILFLKANGPCSIIIFRRELFPSLQSGGLDKK